MSNTFTLRQFYCYNLITVFLFFVKSLFAKPFPGYLFSNVTNTQDWEQMMWQLGISFPALPPKLQDPNTQCF